MIKDGQVIDTYVDGDESVEKGQMSQLTFTGTCKGVWFLSPITPPASSTLSF